MNKDIMEMENEPYREYCRCYLRQLYVLFGVID